MLPILNALHWVPNVEPEIGLPRRTKLIFFYA